MFVRAFLGLVAVALPFASAHCYNGNNDPTRFKDLHGVGSNTQDWEVFGDISRFCDKIKNTEITRGQPLTDCSNWPKTHKGPNDGACAACHFFRNDCEEECREDPNNSINFAVDLADVVPEGETRTISFSACEDAMRTEKGGCMYGGENTHGSFWYKIDPNPGSC